MKRKKHCLSRWITSHRVPSYRPAPYTQGIDKASTLHESKLFNKPSLDAKKCKGTLIKILYLLAMGETFATTEATELFFNTTKLLQSQDVCICDGCTYGS